MLHPRAKPDQLILDFPAGSKLILWLVLVSLVVILAGCGDSQTSAGQNDAQRSIAGPLTDPGLDLHAGPVDVPLELKIPSLGVSAPMIGVGLTPENLMDAPKGTAGDPVWQKVFWYRGSGVPGDSGTATTSGHVNDVLGRPAVFARLMELRPGDPILVHDTRSGLDVHFTVAKMETYSLQQSGDPSILTQVYGSGPASGGRPQPAPDGRSHLTLITCAGDFVNGSYDHRLVVYAERTDWKITFKVLRGEPWMEYRLLQEVQH
jgi:sortase (surface protein transpeptidase)